MKNIWNLILGRILIGIFVIGGGLWGMSCSNPSEKPLPIPSETICFKDLENRSLSELLKSTHTRYILLRNENSKELLGRIDKIKIINDRIYIADTKLRSLAVYDMQGNFISQIGKRGQGPDEYVNLTDFDVDKEGNVFVLDARQNKLLCYDKDFTCIDDTRLDFQADILTALDNDSLLFGLSSWNKKEGKGRKIAKADRKGNIAKTFLDYDEYVDPAYWISMYTFAAAGDVLAYNQTIDNTIYLFSKDGELSESITLDFGSENVPDEDKVNIERKLESYDSYCLIRKIVAVTDNAIIGFIWQHRQTKLFVIDRKSGCCYLSDALDDVDRRPGCGYFNGELISYIDAESEALPDSVNEFVRNEGFVLLLQSVRSSR